MIYERQLFCHFFAILVFFGVILLIIFCTALYCSPSISVPFSKRVLSSASVTIKTIILILVALVSFLANRALAFIIVKTFMPSFEFAFVTGESLWDSDPDKWILAQTIVKASLLPAVLFTFIVGKILFSDKKLH